MNKYRMTPRQSGYRDGGQVKFAREDFTLTRPHPGVGMGPHVLFVKGKDGVAYITTKLKITEEMREQAALIVDVENVEHYKHEFTCSEEVAREIAKIISRIRGWEYDLVQIIPFEFRYTDADPRNDQK